MGFGKITRGMKRIPREEMIKKKIKTFFKLICNGISDDCGGKDDDDK